MRPSHLMSFTFHQASEEDIAALATLHTLVAEQLTHKYGRGPWSSKTTEKGIRFAMRTLRVFVARDGKDLVGTLRLTTRKPWAINTDYFTPCTKPLYLVAMAVMPERQRQGFGRKCLEAAIQAAWAWPADAIPLDAFDSPAGAGPFYSRCGWTKVAHASYRNAPLLYYELRRT